MRLGDIDPELMQASFEFFYWFSRFEFSLKENRYLKSLTLGENAEPSWKQFHERFGPTYKESAAASELIKLHPKRQIVAAHDLDWKPAGIQDCTTQLCKVVRMLTTIRNNLFHGGKHGDTDVDDRTRNLQLLRNGKTVLDELAEFAEFDGDYHRYY